MLHGVKEEAEETHGPESVTGVPVCVSWGICVICPAATLDMEAGGQGAVVTTPTPAPAPPVIQLSSVPSQFWLRTPIEAQ